MYLWVGVAIPGCGSDGGPATPDGPPPALSLPSPFPHSVSNSPQTSMRLFFDRPLDRTIDPPLELRVFGRWSGVVGTRVLDGSFPDVSFVVELDRPLAAGEQVTATLVAGSYRSRTGVVGEGYSWTFGVGTMGGGLNQSLITTIPVRRPNEGHIQTYGAYAGDLDGDGWSDLVVPNERSADLRVFLNDGAGGYGAFEVVPIPGAVTPSANEGADFNGDGHIDLVVGSAGGTLAGVFHGDGAGGLMHVQNLNVGESVRAVCIVDFENDGDPDIIATAATADLVAFFENLGAGMFVSAGTMNAGDGEWSCAPGDLDSDGRMDVFIGSRGSGEIAALVSNGDGTFTETSRVSAGGDPWMLASGDIDGDGQVDAVAVNAASPSLAVILGNGAGGLALSDVHTLDGFPLAIDLGDLDRDGDLDAIASDFSTGEFVLFENDAGALIRRNGGLFAQTAASCAILHDRDNDGDLDLTGIDEIDDLIFLFENRP